MWKAKNKKLFVSCMNFAPTIQLMFFVCFIAFKGIFNFQWISQFSHTVPHLPHVLNFVKNEKFSSFRVLFNLN